MIKVQIRKSKMNIDTIKIGLQWTQVHKLTSPSEVLVQIHKSKLNVDQFTPSKQAQSENLY